MQPRWPILLALGLIVSGIVLDQMVFDGVAIIFLGKQLLRITDYLVFWR